MRQGDEASRTGQVIFTAGYTGEIKVFENLGDNDLSA